MPVLDPDPVWFPQAVESVLAQTLPDLELIIVEDPGTGPGAGDLLGRFPDPRIRHLRNPTRTSMAAARNLGLSLARAPIIAMFDGDDVCDQRRLETQVAFLAEHPEVDVVGTWISVIEGSGRVLGVRRYPLEHERIVRAMRLYNPLAHPSVVVRAAAVAAAGGYVARPDNVCEDYDLWSRMVRSGARFANVGEPLVAYRVHAAATKSRRLRDTLRATLGIKRSYWAEHMDLAARARMLAERVLLVLPNPLVTALFLKCHVRRS